ncbi:aldo/keto reductase [Pollutimonas sp. M17]|uniref:aldo/keto reductase n=1 Tax=Pollutimonas sp. M17 TaxID=2962065 RepID=UPI0021F436E3|nr:aldo/keto reductase [Pollutimonas sp. M17]UYO93981.1 aldo/keto reductase [Pollutimonas sp. M17]
MSQRLALGTVQFGLEYGIANKSGRVLPGSAAAILSEAAAHGIDILDTAISYGDSERVLGAVGVVDWKVVSKMPAVPDECTDIANWVRDQIKGSLTRLRVSRLYGLLLHRPDQLLGPHGRSLLNALEDIKNQGLAQKIGVSIYAPEDLALLSDVMQLDLVQAPLNILDRRLVDSGWARRLKQQGTELHIRSVFLQGLLLMHTSHRPAEFSRWQPLWSVWDKWLNHTGQTPLQACLRYGLSIDDVDRVVVGVDSADQLREILVAAQGSLDSVPAWPEPLDADLINPARWH